MSSQLKFNDTAFIFMERNDEIVIVSVNPSDDRVYKVKGLARRFFLEAVKADPNFKKLYLEIHESYGVTEEKVKGDAEAFFSDLQRAGIFLINAAP